MSDKPIQRVLLKLSGEALSEGGLIISSRILISLAHQIKELWGYAIDFGIVVGGGNIFRGLAGQKKGFDRTRGDYMGMYATVVNALGLQDALAQVGLRSHVLSALGGGKGTEAFDESLAESYFERREVVIFAGGTGSPFCSTDTAAVLRALQIKADAVLKATNVEGVFDSDPRQNDKAKLFRRLPWDKAVELKLGVMDSTAFSMAQENKMPIIVFNMNKPGNLALAIQKGDVGTRVDGSTEILFADS